MHVPPDVHLRVEATRHAELQARSRRWRLRSDVRAARPATAERHAVAVPPPRTGRTSAAAPALVRTR